MINVVQTNLLKNLKELAEFGLNLDNNIISGEFKTTYDEMLDKQTGVNKDKVLKEKISKILDVITQNQSEKQLESRVRFQGNTYFSDILSSFLGDFMDSIKTFSKLGNIEGFKKILKILISNLLIFIAMVLFLNKWLEELYNSDLNDESSFANNFEYERLLGTEDSKFENLSPKDQTLTLLNAYFSDKQISPKSQYGKYHVFVLGDSGASKFIKAKRYSEQEIIDGLYNVYLQEKRRSAITKAVNEKLKEGNYKQVDNFSKKGSEFTILKFLNDPKK